MRRGRRIAFDPGSVRIGVAVCDPDGILASPHEPVSADDGAALRELIAEVEPLEIVIGLPRGLDGNEGAAAQAARSFASKIASEVNFPCVWSMSDFRPSKPSVASTIKASRYDRVET